MSQNKVTIAEEWVLGLEDIPFFTKRVSSLFSDVL